MNVKNNIAIVLVALAVGCGCASAKTSEKAPTAGPMAEPSNSTARDVAIRDCNKQAAKWSSMSWQSAQIVTYGDCMTEHNQPQ